MSAATFADDIANWSIITVAADKTPECRLEFSTYTKAIAALRSLISFLSGNPPAGADGYEDICTAAGLAFY